MNSRDGSPVFELLVVFGLVYIFQVLTSTVQSLTGLASATSGLFVLAPPLTDDPWTVVTSVYAHADLRHLLSNAVALVLFGWPVARATSRLRFHAFFLTSGALAGITQVLTTVFLARFPFVGAEPTAVLGASGGVFALLGYLLASNRISSSLGSAVAAPRWLVAAIFVLVAAVLTLLTAAPGVAIFAHFAGLLVGLFSARLGLLDSDPGTAR